MESLEEQFGGIDIYLFDQLLRGRIAPGHRIVDAGCGFGRNLVYLLRSGYEVYGVDTDPEAVAWVSKTAATLAPASEGNFRVASVEAMGFPDAFADVVISNTVLHFARDEEHFRSMLYGTWRVLKPGGLFFSRLASLEGMEGRFRHVAGRRYVLLDGTERFLVDEKMLMDLTAELGGRLADPLKTTIVHGQRSMTTWVVRKNE